MLAINCAVQTAHGEEVELPAWLPNINDGSNIEHSAVRELWFLAIVWMLLHELQHIVFKENDEALSPHDEEFACDKAAFDWLLSKGDVFAATSSQPSNKIRGKRAMGALIALFGIVWLSERDQSVSHPSVIRRLSVLLDEIGEEDSGMFWEFSIGLIYVLNRKRENVIFPRPGTVRDVVLALAEGLT